ncbi:ABC transporter permease [Aquimarina sp. D1M17]|uniref:ABC transporter permease n=1 Tax=Aquimarina acroporae TaxID=2937283 RepID=UPI0020C094B4|nr:ABC transporter permease [Aquimarina acroporae]MCK8521251.1 ABC transporter permease [Aquimarina acroporae]
MSVLLLMISIALATFVLQIRSQLNRHLESNIKPFDMVVGAKGSPLQLVLSSVLHIDNPTGNISFEKARNLVRGRMVKEKIPVAYGDNYKGIRILGTTKRYLTVYSARINRGRLNEKPFEVVLGDQAAKKIGLQIGDTFVSSHGLAESGFETHDEKPFTVTGILKPSGTVVDHLIITTLESIWQVHEHEDDHSANEDEHEGTHEEEEEHKEVHGIHDGAKHGEEQADMPSIFTEDYKEEHNEGHGKHEEERHVDHDLHKEEKEITSVLVKFRNPVGALQRSRFINEETAMQAALPKFEIERLMKFLGVGFQTINIMAIVILLFAGLSIFINLVKTVRERKQELALLRTYGANTLQLMLLVFMEALFLSLIGFVLGWVFGRLGVLAFSKFSTNSYGYHFAFGTPDSNELFVFIIVILTTLLAAILASLSIFKLNVSKIITDA